MSNAFKTDGFSLRESLIRQGVRDENKLREHLSFVGKTISVNPHLNIMRYKVTPKGETDHG